MADGNPSIQKIQEKLGWVNKSLMKFNKNPSTAGKITPCFSTGGQLAALGPFRTDARRSFLTQKLVQRWKKLSRGHGVLVFQRFSRQLGEATADLMIVPC